MEEDAAEEAPAEAEEVTEPEGTQNDEMEEKVDPREKKMRQSRRNRNRSEPDGGENAGMTEPGKTGETEPEGPENAGAPDPGGRGRYFQRSMAGQEEIGGGDGEQMEPPEEENGSAGSDDATGGDKTAEVSSDSDLSQSAEPPAAEAEPVFSAEQEAERTRES